MSAAYWKMVGDNVSRGLGRNTVRRLGTGGRALGRAGAALGMGFLLFELFRDYRHNIESEPAFQEMRIVQSELEKWSGAVSCIGRRPYEGKTYGSFEEGGAINALYPKLLLDGHTIRPPDIREAVALVKRAAALITETGNVMNDADFDDRKSRLIGQLSMLAAQLPQVDDKRPIQQALTGVTRRIKPIESGLAARIYDCSREIQKTLGSNAAWAGLSMVTFGMIKKH